MHFFNGNAARMFTMLLWATHMTYTATGGFSLELGFVCFVNFEECKQKKQQKTTVGLQLNQYSLIWAVNFRSSSIVTVIVSATSLVNDDLIT